MDHVETGACIRWLAATEGDVIALALDVRHPDLSIARNTAAWIAGTPPPLVSYDTITLAEVRELVGVTAPETSTEPDEGASGNAAAPAALIVAAGAALLVFSRTKSFRRRAN
jgi:hypothetical protein